MNTLVHIVRFYARESVVYAQKDHKVSLGLNVKIGVYIIRLKAKSNK